MTDSESTPVGGPTGTSLARVGLLASARRWGALVWSEARLSTVLSDAVAGIEEPEVAVAVASAARRHGERAGTVRGRLPELRELPVAEVVAPGSTAWAACLDGLTAAPDVGALLATYAGRVLPALEDAYRASAEAASEVAEPSARRVLGDLAEQVGRERDAWSPRIDGDPTGPVPTPVEVLGEPPAG